MRWHGARASTRSRSTTALPPGSPRTSGCGARSGRPTITALAFAPDPLSDPYQRVERGRVPQAPDRSMTEQTPVTQAAAAPVTLPDAQEVTEVRHYTDRLFSFKTTRPPSLRFRSGEFVMIGLMGDPDPKTGKQKPLMRAYSIASPSWDDELEFYSLKVADGPLTSRLQHIEPGDRIILRPKPVGTLVHDALLPGKRLWLFATGTGFALRIAPARPRDIRELRPGHRHAHLPGGRRAHLFEGDDRENPLRRTLRRTHRRGGPRQARLLPDDDARREPQDGPHHRTSEIGRGVPRPRSARGNVARRRPGDGLRLDGPQPRPEGHSRGIRASRGRQLGARRICGREGLRRIGRAAGPPGISPGLRSRVRF